MKSFDFDNDKSEKMFSNPYINYMTNERLQEEEQFHFQNYTLEMPRSYANMCLKSAPQKLNFVMTQSRSKIYTLDCSCKWLLALSHIVMHSLYVVFYKNHSM